MDVAKDFYLNDQLDELDLLIKNAKTKNQKIDLSFINLQKRYEDDNNTLFEKCILHQKYGNIRKYL